MRVAILVLSLTLAAVVLVPSGKHSDIEGYRSWTRVTKDPVDMADYVAALCISVPVLEGDNPHTPKRYLVYVNDAGKAAMLSKKDVPFPVGSVIVKEKYDRRGKLGTPELLTVMVKGAKGSSSATGDWTFYVADAEGRRLEGPTQHCVACHQKLPNWVFRSYGTVPPGALKKFR